MQTLSRDSLFEILSKMPVSDIFNLCKTDKAMSKYCADDTLWKILYARDYVAAKSPQQTWKQAYEEQYAFEKIFKKSFPFWYKHRADKQLADIFAPGWMKAYHQFQNAPSVFKSGVLETLYEESLTIDPDVHFSNDQGRIFKRPNIVFKANKPHYFMIFSPNTSDSVLMGVHSYLQHTGSDLGMTITPLGRGKLVDFFRK